MARRWLLGTRDYAHPALRWAALPTLRLGILLLIVFVRVGGEAHKVLRVVGVALLVVSIVAELTNEIVLRSRRRRANREQSA
jgi:hypothetical protein